MTFEPCTYDICWPIVCTPCDPCLDACCDPCWDQCNYARPQRIIPQRRNIMTRATWCPDDYMAPPRFHGRRHARCCVDHFCAPSCEAPACVAPVCVAPACVAPVCAAPVCAAPVCAAPACEAPMCVAPACAVPQCVAPTCVVPDCVAPACVAPACVAPVCAVPAACAIPEYPVSSHYSARSKRAYYEQDLPPIDDIPDGSHRQFPVEEEAPIELPDPDTHQQSKPKSKPESKKYNDSPVKEGAEKVEPKEPAVKKKDVPESFPQEAPKPMPKSDKNDDKAPTFDPPFEMPEKKEGETALGPPLVPPVRFE
ncbi:hypothetical protein [Rubinisphaera margarita]|uniref:hypothetical protein n=1 Tax=Rubinisphaera margarita TaxID=2909586 RepID=UPI001EE93A1E|nr:hypothetical protein [Rubinisphaera margarita]MCG6158508.1 hypothetical protein [Rubinisphaera margarita]